MSPAEKSHSEGLADHFEQLRYGMRWVEKGRKVKVGRFARPVIGAKRNSYVRSTKEGSLWEAN